MHRGTPSMCSLRLLAIGSHMESGLKYLFIFLNFASIFEIVNVS